MSNAATVTNAEMAQWIGLFLDGGVIEFRAPKVKYKGTCSGWFSEITAAVKEAKRLDALNNVGVYVTLNQVDPTLLARANNRFIEKMESTSNDDNVLRRQWVLIDCDPKRLPHISSTDAEHDLALATASTIARDLSDAGWPDPVRADSGNGAHLLYRVAMPNTPTETVLITSFLASLADRYDVPGVMDIDRKVFNASRITKLYGTMARKGEDMPDRPHRRSRVLSIPSEIEVADESLFAAYVLDHPPKVAPKPVRPTSPAPISTKAREPYDVEAFISRAGLDVIREGNCGDGAKWVLSVCPWNPEHTDNAAWIAQFASGAVAAGCQHNGCTGNDWDSLRAMFDPKKPYTPRELTEDHRPEPSGTPAAAPDPLPPLTEAQLASVASMADYRPGNGPYPPGYKKLDMANWIAHFAIAAQEVSWVHGRRWHLDVCPWDSEHTTAGVSQRTEGAIAAWCSHPDCANKKWADLREKYDPKGAPKALRVREAKAGAIPNVVAEIPSNLHEMFANYVALVGTESIFDRRTGRTITMTALKLAHPLEVKAWVEGPERLSVDVDKLVFRPEGSDPGEFNLFTGLPKLEVIDRSGVTAWLDHGNSMANDADIAFWLFSRFAYKIQNPGKKVVSSVVIHGEQGTGKNLFFAPLLAIYGKYGAVIGQQQIESPYTDWLSGKLLLVADEVASRGERYHIKNKLKGLISGDTIAINAKFQATRWERNCADLHFLSNEEIPVVVEPGDRRFAVIRYDVVHPKPYFAQLAAVDPGALYEMLMEWDCGAFNAHTEPPPTKAKTDLVDLTKEPSDRFLDAWLAAELPIPAAGGATGADLFRAYDVWTKANNERKVIQSSIEFGRIVAKRLSQFQIRVNDGHPRVWSTDGARPESEGIREFSAALARWILAEQKARV